MSPRFESRKAEKRRLREEESWRREEARLQEEARLAKLTTWERIEESDASDSVKDILHRIATQCGLEN